MDSSTSEGIHSHHGSYGVTAETIKQNKVQKKQKKLTMVGTNGGLILLASKSFQFKVCTETYIK